MKLPFAVIFLLTAAVASATLPSPAARIGLTFALGTPTQGTTAVTIARIQDLGVKLVRQTTYADVSWAQVELVDNTFTFSTIDEVTNSTVGFTVHPTLYGISAGANDIYGLQVPFNLTAGITDGWKTSRDSVAAQNYVQTVVARYKSVVRHWEISNEMESKVTRPLGLPTTEFAAFLVLNRGWIRAIDSEALVVLPGISGTYGLPLANGQQWLRNLLAAGGAAGFDVFSYHDYNSWWTLPKHFDDYRAILDTNGLSAVPIWVTESSISSGTQTSITPSYSSIDGQAADVWRRSCLLFSKGALNFNWHGHYSNGATSSGDGFAEFGLLTSSGNIKKKSWHSFKLLVQKIEGFTAARLLSSGTITDDNTSGGAGTWVVEFTFSGGTKKYVAWSPNAQSYSLTGLTRQASATLTTVVPASVTTDGNTPTWTTSSRAITNATLALTLADAPILIETSTASLPDIATQPTAQIVTSGSAATFTVVASGTAPFTYQWSKDGTAIAGATSATYTISSTATTSAGSYTCTVTNAAGAVTSSAVTLTVNTAFIDPARLINLSILTTLTANELFTVGTVIGGGGTTGSKALLVRAAGPSLTALGVGGALPDPKLDLFSGQTVVATNDNWAGTLALNNAFTSVGAFAYSAATSKDAAIFNATQAAGSYTIQVTGVGGATGTVIAELYDATPAGTFTATTPRLVNVSVLKKLAAGETLIAGFVVGGTGTKTVLIRAVGPSLAVAPFNIAGVMTDPKLDLYSGQTVINSNNDWSTPVGTGASNATQLSAAFTSVGAFTLVANSKDAALLVTLAPGSYTAQVSGVSNTSGFAIIEVYEVP